MITFVVVGSNSLYFKILFFVLVFVFQSQSFGLCLRLRFSKCLYQSKNPFAIQCKGILIFFQCMLSNTDQVTRSIFGR